MSFEQLVAANRWIWTASLVPPLPLSLRSLARMVKEQFRDTDVVRRLSQVQFGMQSPQEMEQCAHLQVVAKNLYNQVSTWGGVGGGVEQQFWLVASSLSFLFQDAERSTVSNGVLDHRMGTSQKDQGCLTCGRGLSDCPGHFGYINLELPVFHVGYFRAIIQVLQCVCKTCSRILMKKQVAAQFRERIRKRELPYLVKKSMKKKAWKNGTFSSFDVDYVNAVVLFLCRWWRCARS